MARKKKDDFVRTLTKIAGGKSFCITLPIGMVRELQWESQQKVAIKKWGRKIIIEDLGESLINQGKKINGDKNVSMIDGAERPIKNSVKFKPVSRRIKK